MVKRSRPQLGPEGLPAPKNAGVCEIFVESGELSSWLSPKPDPSQTGFCEVCFLLTNSDLDHILPKSGLFTRAKALKAGPIIARSEEHPV